MKRSLGVCYYPEHWPEEIWARDAQQMVETGLTWVRIGEFAWSRLEPQPGQFDWGWLDRAIATLGQAGLKVILGTPTATPPRWMLDKYPDMLGHTSAGEIRKFGSRRHYCFSHAPYRDEARRIARLMAERYGTNPTIAAWQTDNEYDCHDTAISYSVHAKRAFQDWCAQRYQSPQALNAAWGNAFWSMEYDSFDQLDLPNQTVTEPNPSHVLAFRRFSSDQVVLFNRVQCDEIRKYSDRPIIHNFMGRITAFDHYDLGAAVVAGSIGPSHGFVHVKEVGMTVTVFGMQVADGDLIHADRHGAVVIPPDVLPILEVAILKLLDTEKLVLNPARRDGFDFDAFEAAWTAFENART